MYLYRYCAIFLLLYCMFEAWRYYFLYVRIVGYGRCDACGQCAADAALHALFVHDGWLRIRGRIADRALCRRPEPGDGPARVAQPAAVERGCGALLCRDIRFFLARSVGAFHLVGGDSVGSFALHTLGDCRAAGRFRPIFGRRCADRRDRYAGNAQFGFPFDGGLLRHLLCVARCGGQQCAVARLHGFPRIAGRAPVLHDRAAQAVLMGFRAEFVNGSRNACGIRAVTGFLAFAQLAGMFVVKVSNRLCARRSRR